MVRRETSRFLERSLAMQPRMELCVAERVGGGMGLGGCVYDGGEEMVLKG